MARKRVLVVDDEQAVRDLTQALLQRLGYSVAAAGSGVEALRLVDLERFDLVVTDLFMPEMSGGELAREIRKRDEQLPIVLITGARDAEVPPGFMAVVYKPFTLSDLQLVTKRVFPEEA
ncbi:MAG: response regulator [Verrucomicrobiota bacterium]